MRMMRLAADSLSSTSKLSKHHVSIQYLQDVIVPKVGHYLTCILLWSLLGILQEKMLRRMILCKHETYIFVTGWWLWEEIDV